MTVPERSNDFGKLREILDGDGDHLTAVEAHGLLCAMAVHPAPPESWPDIAAGEDTALPSSVYPLLERERQRIASRLGAGESVQLPCRLDPFEERDGEDLTAWCTGFMAGVVATERDWLPRDDQSLEELLLPFLLFSGLDDDPALDELWRDESLVRQMARGLPDLLEELFLRLQAPELKD